MTEELRDAIMVVLDDIIKLKTIISSISIPTTDPAPSDSGDVVQLGTLVNDTEPTSSDSDGVTQLSGLIDDNEG